MSSACAPWPNGVPTIGANARAVAVRGPRNMVVTIATRFVCGGGSRCGCSGIGVRHAGGPTGRKTRACRGKHGMAGRCNVKQWTAGCTRSLSVHPSAPVAPGQRQGAKRGTFGETPPSPHQHTLFPHQHKAEPSHQVGGDHGKPSIIHFARYLPFSARHAADIGRTNRVGGERGGWRDGACDH